MNIIYLCNTAIPSKKANSINIIKMCQAFTMLGHKVRLYSRTNSKQNSLEVLDIYKYYGVDSSFEVERTKTINVSGIGIIVYSYMVKQKVSNERTPDLIYGRDILSIFFVRNLGVPFMVEVHHTPGNFIFKYLLKIITINKNFRGIIVISKRLKRKYVELYPHLNGDKILVAYNGCEVPQKSKRNKILLKRPCVGYIGHLYPGKGMEIIMKIAIETPWVDYHIIGGNGKDIKIWQQRCADLNNIVFHGYVEHKNITQYYENLDIVLLPQQKLVYMGNIVEYGENMVSLKIFEYMAHSKAIVASDFPAVREILKHELNSLLCPSDRPDMWVNSINRLINDASLRERISKKAYLDFRNNYTWGKRASKVLDKLIT